MNPYFSEGELLKWLFIDCGGDPEGAMSMQGKESGEWKTDASGKRYRRVTDNGFRYTEYEMRIQTSNMGEITESMLAQISSESGKDINSFEEI